MPTFSIIVPVYNVEKYIDRCLKSIVNQSYSDYEIIVINDGSEDNSIEIAKKYPIKLINQKNSGLSAARNAGIKKATGKYLIFIDSDDFIEKDLLKNISKSLENSPDLIRFQAQTIDENNNIKKFPEKSFSNKTGVEAFQQIVSFHFVESAWCYAYKRSFFEQEKFSFKKGTVHEDYGLVPLIIMKAKIVNSISYIGYNYFKRSGSIMTKNDYSYTKKKVEDFYNHYQYLIKEINKTSLDSKIFKSYAANSVILKICELNNFDYKLYKKKLNKDKVFNNLLTDSYLRKIKKILLQISPKMFYKYIAK